MMDELKEQEAELRLQNEEDEAVIQDGDATSSDRGTQEKEWWKEPRSLRFCKRRLRKEKERFPFRERVKEVFEKYGVTVTAIVLAAGVTIGAIIGAITNSLKALGKCVGNGLKRERFFPFQNCRPGHRFSG